MILTLEKFDQIEKEFLSKPDEGETTRAVVSTKAVLDRIRSFTPEQAESARKLKDLFGLSESEIRFIISEARVAGHAIVPKHRLEGGYFYTDDPMELFMAALSMIRRAMKVLRSGKAMKYKAQRMAVTGDLFGGEW